jgi:putative membrane protein
MTELKTKNTSDHLANERTFLAWIRTSIGIMAFGFVVVKFSLFVKQLSILLSKQNITQSKGYSAFIGIALVAGGAFTSVLSYLRYKKTQNQINNGIYQSSSLIIFILTSVIFLISIFLIVYLVEST